jgi:hypothetical protein
MPPKNGGNQPKGQPKQPSCKEEADQLAKLVGSNAWAKKKKKVELKKARKQRRRLQGPLYPYSMQINGIEENSSLSLTEWHGINADLVGWIASEILAASDHDDLSNFNIEEYKFIEHPEKDGVKTALKPVNERKGWDGEGAAHKVRSRERAAAKAAAKAAEKAAEEANATAEAVQDDVGSDDNEDNAMQ